VSRALRLSLAFAALIGLTAAPKLIGVGRIAEPDGARLARDMGAALAAQGFRTAVVAYHLFDYVLARKGDCTLVAANMDAAGSLRERFAEETARIGPVLYHYGDATGPDFPRLAPAVAEHLQIWAYRIGIVAGRAPVIAIAASPGCRPGAIDWTSLRIWPAPKRQPL
jgi:hypothetical protein